MTQQEPNLKQVQLQNQKRLFSFDILFLWGDVSLLKYLFSWDVYISSLMQEEKRYSDEEILYEVMYFFWNSSSREMYVCLLFCKKRRDTVMKRYFIRWCISSHEMYVSLLFCKKRFIFSCCSCLKLVQTKNSLSYNVAMWNLPLSSTM